MNFNKHSEIRGQHAFLSPSNYHWINYDKDKLISAYRSREAVKRGTRLHELAAMLIEEKQKLPKSKKTLNMYVNDAIGFNMIPEQPLYYSRNCFGTCDTFCFRNNFLRIHDLKTGREGHMEQLMLYAALFCLDYNIDPKSIEFELRLYQCDAIEVCNPTPDEVQMFIEIIISADEVIEHLRQEGRYHE